MNVIIDSNLLALLVVGSASRAYISIHKRVMSFTESDYDLLTTMIGNASKVLVTPHALAETSNLIGYINKEPARTHIFQAMAAIAGELEEKYNHSRVSMERSEFINLGLTDCSMMDLSDKSTVLLTTDLDLWAAATKAGYIAQNFNHLRSL